jgi:hypothetical protein
MDYAIQQSLVYTFLSPDDDQKIEWSKHVLISNKNKLKGYIYIFLCCVRQHMINRLTLIAYVADTGQYNPCVLY